MPGLNRDAVSPVSAGLFGTFRPVPRARARATAGMRTLIPPVRTQRTVALTVAHQEQTNWCWAAVSTSIAKFFRPTSPWTQCKLVSTELKGASCCGAAGSGSACNQPWYLDEALEQVGRLARMTGQAESFLALQREIDNGKPLCARIGWRDGGGHFVALSGWRTDTTGTAFVKVEDPWSGESEVPFAVFQTDYQGSGSWTHSYYVTAADRVSGSGKALRAGPRDPRAIGG